MTSIIEEFVEDNLRPKAHQLKIAEEAIYYINTRADKTYKNACKTCAIEHMVKNSMDYSGVFCNEGCEYGAQSCHYGTFRKVIL